MNYTIEHIHDKLFIIKTDGEFNLADFYNLSNKLLNHSDWEPGANCVFDYRNTDFSKMNLGDLDIVSCLHENKNATVGEGKSALVMMDLLNFGIGRVYEGIASGRVSTKFKIFKDYQEALRWAAS